MIPFIKDNQTTHFREIDKQQHNSQTSFSYNSLTSEMELFVWHSPITPKYTDGTTTAAATIVVIIVPIKIFIPNDMPVATGALTLENIMRK